MKMQMRDVKFSLLHLLHVMFVSTVLSSIYHQHDVPERGYETRRFCF
jgi:hypothetical protein